jgi:hypothetical protein
MRARDDVKDQLSFITTLLIQQQNIPRVEEG